MRGRTGIEPPTTRFAVIGLEDRTGPQVENQLKAEEPTRWAASELRTGLATEVMS